MVVGGTYCKYPRMRLLLSGTEIVPVIFYLVIYALLFFYRADVSAEICLSLVIRAKGHPVSGVIVCPFCDVRIFSSHQARLFLVMHPQMPE